MPSSATSARKAKLGKYSLHFHLVGDTMRGTSVIGASIWDSGNRWITIHGTNYLVVRDCVGYRAIGHGFFLEDGTEVYNVLDRNLAVQALPAAAVAGPGRSRSTATRGPASGGRTAGTRSCGTSPSSAIEYGFRFEAPAVAGFDPTMAGAWARTARSRGWISGRCRSSASRGTRPMRSGDTA